VKADEILLNLDVNPNQRLIELAESHETTIDQKISCYNEIENILIQSLNLKN